MSSDKTVDREYGTSEPTEPRDIIPRGPSYIMKNTFSTTAKLKNKRCTFGLSGRKKSSKSDTFIKKEM